MYPKTTIKKALITDWLDKYGGAERVVTAICELYNFDYYYTYVNKMCAVKQRFTFFNKNVNVTESSLFKNTKAYFRYLMPFFPSLVRSFNKQTEKNKVNLVISSSWALSKGYRIGNEVHICYLQARNFKYIWEDANLYFKGPLKLLTFLKKNLQRFDVKSAQNPDYLISNSIFVQNWVKEKYSRDSHVIYPPVDVDDFQINEKKEDYYITIGRLEPYKRFDIVIDAFSENKKKLIVIGDGSQRKGLEKNAGENITFIGFREKEVIKEYLSKAKGFVFAGIEDFGIVFVEALASGIPIIAYEGGATKEIVETGVNGLTYSTQTADSLNECILQFEKVKDSFNPIALRKTALRFSKKRFQNEFSAFVEAVKEKHNLNRQLRKVHYQLPGIAA